MDASIRETGRGRRKRPHHLSTPPPPLRVRCPIPSGFTKNTYPCGCPPYPLCPSPSPCRSRSHPRATTRVPTPHPLRSRPYGKPQPSSFFSSSLLNLTPIGRDKSRPYALACYIGFIHPGA